MLTLAVVCLVIGYLLGVPILVRIGWVVLAIALILLLAGSIGAFGAWHYGYW